jgi:DNA-binding MarR family transcriptional regulator
MLRPPPAKTVRREPTARCASWWLDAVKGSSFGRGEQGSLYALKRTATALRTAMEASLRSHGLSVPQYSCLEILNARPGISNADLARGVFVTRQAMHQLLGGLQEAELVSAGGQGRVQRYSLTAEGQRIIAAASAAVAAVEEQMLSGLQPSERQRLHNDLERCTAALGED